MQLVCMQVVAYPVSPVAMILAMVRHDERPTSSTDGCAERSRRCRGNRPARWLFPSLLAIGLTACSEATTFVRLDDLDGGQQTPQQVTAGHTNVIVFTSHECPIANSYAPTMAGLAAEWSEQPVRLFLVHVDPDLSVDAASVHRGEYELPGTILMDPKHQLATALGITRTPEAVVLSEAGLIYRGRIDDQWADLGVRSPAATIHDLRDAVASARRGDTVPPPHPPAVGCLLPEPAH